MLRTLTASLLAAALCSSMAEAAFTFRTVALTGTAAPGTGAGVNFSSFLGPVLNAAGQTAFIGGLIGAGVNHTNNQGIWSEGGGSGLALVARAGAAAPGTAAGVNFNFFDFSSPVLNGAGQTAFLGYLTGAGVNGTNNEGIWSEGGGAGLALVARKGDLFDVNDDTLVDDLRTISSLSLVAGSGGEGGRPTSFNDAGQLAFWLSFTDGSRGVFVATPVPVPEPTTAGLVMVSLAALLPHRRRTA